MATIEKMMIRGIRSYSPDDSCVIEFFKPLTLIVGANGSGKTTIIECLRYACTGEVPPNSTRGQAFLFDPRISGDPEIKAQIRFRFQTITKKPVTCIRSMSLIQKPNSQQFKAFDSALITYNEAGEKIMQTMRCADLDREIPELMGISKAILDNVIFCHQEESDWPLDTASNLKKKFDEIFASTRYSKALEVIKKFRQEQSAKIKDLSSELKLLKEYKDSADEKQMEINRLKQLAQQSSQSSGDISQKISQIESQIAELEEEMYSITQITEAINSFLAKKNSDEKTIIHLQDSGAQYTESDEDLRLRLLELSSNTSKTQEHLRNATDSIQKTRRLLGQENEKIQQLVYRKGNLEAELKIKESKMKEQLEMQSKLKSKYGLEVNESQPIGPQIDSQMSKAKAMQVKKLSDGKSSLTAGVEGLEKSLLKLKREEMYSEQMINHNRELIQQRTRDKQSLLEKQSKNQNIDGLISELRNKITSQEEDIKKLNATFDGEIISARIESCKEAKRQYDRDTQALLQEEREFSRNAEQRSVFDSKKDELERKTEEMSLLSEKLSYAVQELFGNLGPDADITSTTERSLKKAAALYDSLEQSIKETYEKLTSQQALREHNLGLQKKSQAKITALREEIEDVCLVEMLPRTIDRLKLKVQKAKSGIMEYSTFDSMLKKFVTLAKEDNWCPMCRRDFDRKASLADIERIASKITSDLPEKQAEKEDELKEMEASLQRHTDQMPKFNQLQKMKEEIQEIDEAEKQYKTIVTSLQQKYDEDVSSKIELESQIECLKVVLQQSQDLDSLEKDIAQLQKEVSKLQKQFTATGQVKTRQSIIQESDEKRAKSMEMDDVVQKLSKELAQHKDTLLAAEKALSELNKKLTDAESQRGAELETKKKIEAIDNEIIHFNSTIRVGQEKLDKARESIRQLEPKVNAATLNLQAFVDDEKAKLQEMENDLSQLERLKREISATTTTTDSLGALEAEYTQAQKRIQDYEQAVQRLKQESDNLQRSAEKGDEVRGSIERCLSYRKILNDIQKYNEEIMSLEEFLQSKRSSSTIQSDLQSLKTQRQKLIEQRARFQGEEQVRNDQLSRLQRDFAQDKFQKSSENYQRTLVQCKVMELANDDMDAYHGALEKALLKYHSQKMDEINKTIKELWQKTYRGNDIDTIEIRAEAEEKNRSSYSYRVVMIKDDVAIDMRGRCSAGQKVLACLIIRLALADSFCTNCALLALDEPTTNLDSRNIRSFASSLNDLIVQRKQTSNFQLIIITHDEEFVSELGRGGNTEHYWRVSKNAAQRSEIERQDLNTR